MPHSHTHTAAQWVREADRGSGTRCRVVGAVAVDAEALRKLRLLARRVVSYVSDRYCSAAPLLRSC